jgi:hypothetical protein
MTCNPWINRAAAAVLLVMVFVAGHDAGHHQATEAHTNHPACNAPLKP